MYIFYAYKTRDLSRVYPLPDNCLLSLVFARISLLLMSFPRPKVAKIRTKIHNDKDFRLILYNNGAVDTTGLMFLEIEFLRDLILEKQF